MEASEWIDLCLKDYVDNNYDFEHCCKTISKHPKLELKILNKTSAIFKLYTAGYGTNIVINNNYQSKYDPEYILNKISLVAGIEVEKLKERSRKREITEPRFAYCLVNIKFKEESGLSLSKIGQLVNIGHCDVLHSLKVKHLEPIKRIYEKTLEIL